jgi:hypothetical protein
MRAKLKVFICVYKFCGYKKRAVRPFGVCTPSELLCYHPKLPLMGATRPASEKCNVYTLKEDHRQRNYTPVCEPLP